MTLFTNKISQVQPEKQIDDNAKALEELAKRINWKLLGRYYAYLFITFVISIFLTIVAIRGALKVF